MQENHIRSVIKGTTWRIVGTLDTIFLSWLITGQLNTAIKIGSIEVFTKIFLFYIHERIWLKSNFGRERVQNTNGHFVKKDKHFRSLIKGVSWRFFGTIDTMTIAFFVTGNYGKAFSIGAIEVFSKILLFYLHERVWHRIKLGTSAEIKRARIFKLKYTHKKNLVIFQRKAKTMFFIKIA